MRESSSNSTATFQVPSSYCWRDVTPSGSSPVISDSWSRARCASFATVSSRRADRPLAPSPARRLSDRRRVRFSSAILTILLLLVARRFDDCFRLDDLGFGLGGLLLIKIATLTLLVDLPELLHVRLRARLLAVDLLGDLLAYPHGETQGGERQQPQLLDQAHAGSSTSRKL